MVQASVSGGWIRVAAVEVRGGAGFWMSCEHFMMGKVSQGGGMEERLEWPHIFWSCFKGWVLQQLRWSKFHGWWNSSKGYEELGLPESKLYQRLQVEILVGNCPLKSGVQ
jgi:hypothetical protein